MNQTTMEEMETWINEFETLFTEKIMNELPDAAVSCGMALHTGDSNFTMQDLYKQADKRMYENKINNRK